MIHQNISWGYPIFNWNYKDAQIFLCVFIKLYLFYYSYSSSESSSFLIWATTICAISFAITFCVSAGQFCSMFIAVLSVVSISYQRPRRLSSKPEPTAEIISSTASNFSSSILCSMIILIKFSATRICVWSSVSSKVFTASDRTGSLSYQRLYWFEYSSFLLCLLFIQ